MDNKNLTPYFKDMSLEEAYAADFNALTEMPPRQIAMLRDICAVSMDVRSVFGFLSVQDKLFTDIYGKGELVNEERYFTYPFIVGKTIPDDVVEVKGPIGTQTSRWHHESLQQHVALVAAKLVDRGVDPEMAAALAVLHDVGKKYTTATNHRGEISFFNHAKVSAFIAAHWLKRLYPQDEQKRRTIIAVVYAHMDAHELWRLTEDWLTKQPVDYRGDFRKQLVAFFEGDEEWTDYVMKLIDTFSECDTGVLDFAPEIEQKFVHGARIILSA